MIVESRLEDPSFGAAILAAGASSRMGRPKLLLPWGKATVLEHLLNQWRALGAEQVIVVCAVGDADIQAELDRLRFDPASRVLNPFPAKGMYHSIQCAAAWPDWDSNLGHVALVLGDQPHLPLPLLQRVVKFAGDNPGRVCQPSRNNRPRHPVFLPLSILRSAASIHAATLKEFLQPQAAGMALCEMDEPLLDLDMDHPADYDRLVALAAPYGDGRRLGLA
jgi:molybdenum cofactor cytidylyltransferase